MLPRYYTLKIIMQLSKRLQILRKERNITVRAAALLLNCSFSHLCKLETGALNRPKLQFLIKLAAFYQFPADTLIIEAGKIPPDVYYKIVNYPELLEIIRNFKP
jgi:transcriptional regulator with XRE-family HTH domain